MLLAYINILPQLINDTVGDSAFEDLCYLNEYNIITCTCMLLDMLARVRAYSFNCISVYVLRMHNCSIARNTIATSACRRIGFYELPTHNCTIACDTVDTPPCIHICRHTCKYQLMTLRLYFRECSSRNIVLVY